MKTFVEEHGGVRRRVLALSSLEDAGLVLNV